MPNALLLLWGDRMAACRNTNYWAWNTIFLSSVFGAVTAFFVVYCFYVSMVHPIFGHNENCTLANGGYHCIFLRDKGWSDADYLQTLTGFYGSVITILVAILAIVAAIGAYTIRSSAKFQIEQEVPQGVSDFFDRERGVNLISARVSSELEKRLNAELRTLDLPSGGGTLGVYRKSEARS
ncbi:hypothetical protein ACTTAI_10630 [Rhodobacter capsulatus]|uniref:hypothetical protein n=1 Tax=Rhodobacter capsulatus TaxID=1061 RepID=UPI0040285A09